MKKTAFNLKKKMDKIPGGLADDKTNKTFDKKQIEKGKKIEKEHTDDPKVAEEIAKDHLVEHKKYYNHLERMEKELEKDKAKN